MKEFTKEQLLISELLKLEQSEGWVALVDVMKKEKQALIESIMEIEPERDEKMYSKNDLDKLMIKYIDGMLEAPRALKNDLEPLIDTGTPNL